jgi:hypothetical protein
VSVGIIALGFQRKTLSITRSCAPFFAIVARRILRAWTQELCACCRHRIKQIELLADGQPASPSSSLPSKPRAEDDRDQVNNAPSTIVGMVKAGVGSSIEPRENNISISRVEKYRKIKKNNKKSRVVRKRCRRLLPCRVRARISARERA